MSIDETWNRLYSYNPRLQAFAVIENKSVIWQTNNWNLVKDVDQLLEAIFLTRETIEVSKEQYKVLRTTGDTLIAESLKGNGFVLMARAKTGQWIVALASRDSLPDLTLIDLRFAASRWLNIGTSHKE